jgi:LPXTG-site transpeptidase (sortase) family protein
VRIIIPKLEVDAPVIELGWNLVFEEGDWRSEWQTADNAAGHHRNSANPGEAGNVVISGHHNTKGEVFREVSEIGQPGVTFGQGDEIVLVTDNGDQYTYTVFGWERFPYEGALPEERGRHTEYLEQTADPTLTLITCWPYESNTHRVVVIAKLQPTE